MDFIISFTVTYAAVRAYMWYMDRRHAVLKNRVKLSTMSLAWPTMPGGSRREYLVVTRAGLKTPYTARWRGNTTWLRYAGRREASA